MATKVNIKTTFEAAKTIEPIYTGGDVSSNSSGTLIATCVDEDVLIVEIRTVKVLCRVEGDGEPVTSLCLTPDASHLIICSRSLSLRIYTLTPVAGSGLLRHELSRTVKPHNTPVVSSAVDVTGSLLATGGADGTVKVWDIRGGYASHTFHGHGGVVSALTFFQISGLDLQTTHKKSLKRKSRDVDDVPMDDAATLEKSICLASGGEDGKIRIWDLNSRKSIAILDSHVSVVRSIRYSDTQHLLLSCSRDRTIIFWRPGSWSPHKIVPALEVLEASDFILDGRYCYSGGENGVIRIWSTSSGTEVTAPQQQGLENDAITAVIQIPGNDTLLSIHQDQTMRIHGYEKLQSVQEGETVEKLPIIRRISGNHDEIIDMACVGPDRSLLALATNTESIRLISVDDRARLSDVQQPTHPAFGTDVAVLEGHEDIIICLDVDWSGHWLATGAKDNTAKLWRLDPATSSYTCFATFAGHAESLGAIALPRSPSLTGGTTTKDPLSRPPAFLLTGSQDKTIKRWDTSKLPHPASAVAQPHTGIKALYTRVAHDKDINALDVSPTAPLFASASQDRTIKIWSLEDGSVAGILRGHKRGVWSIRFSPAGTRPINLADGGSTSSRGLLISGSGDRTVKVWSLSTYTCLLTFEGHSNSVLKVIWIPPHTSSSDSGSPDESRPGHDTQAMIASASSDTLVKLWSPYAAADSDHLLATLDNHTDRVWALVSPLAYQSSSTALHQPPPPSACPYALISGAADAGLTFWRDTTTQTASLASKRATERIEQDQLLQNHIHAKNYREAITLSLALNHPGRLLKVFEDVVNLPEAEKESDSILGVRAVDHVLRSLSHDQIFRLLERVRDWNTNARTSTVAQRILYCLFKSWPASTFVDMAKEHRTGVAGKGMRELLRALEAYTDRHYRRVEELIDESYLLDYTLREMDEVAGTVGAVDGTVVNGQSQPQWMETS